jgi:hypothetical protein
MHYGSNIEKISIDKRRKFMKQFALSDQSNNHAKVITDLIRHFRVF